MSAIEQVRFLAASEHRVAILRSLTTESLSPAQIRDEHDVSRATVHRILDSYKEFGWVQQSEDGYVTTSAGRIILEQFESVRDAATEVEELSDFLSAFERSHELPLPLDEHHVVTASRANPHAAVEYFAATVPTDASQLRALLPAVIPMFNRACEPLVEAGASIQLVLSQSAIRTSQDSYPADFERARSTNSLSLFVSPDAFQFGLSVFDDDVFLGAYDGRGNLQTCLHSTDEDLREWASSLFHAFRNDATSPKASNAD